MPDEKKVEEQPKVAPEAAVAPKAVPIAEEVQSHDVRPDVVKLIGDLRADFTARFDKLESANKLAAKPEEKKVEDAAISGKEDAAISGEEAGDGSKEKSSEHKPKRKFRLWRSI